MPNSKSSSTGVSAWWAGAIFVVGIVMVGFRSLMPYESMSAIVPASVLQGTSQTLWPDGVRGPANGRCEIVAPNGAVVASFVSIAGGSDNGWHAQVNYQGWDMTPFFTVDVPKNTPVGENYRISTARYLWPQSSARFAVVASSAEAAASPFVPVPAAPPKPVGQADAVIRNSGETQYLGGEFYGDDGVKQTVEQVALVNRPAVYLIMVQNQGTEAASFKITATGVGPGWTGNYFAAPVRGRDISREVGSEKGWQTPLLPVDGHIILRVEIRRGDAAAVAATTLVRVLDAGGEIRDAVRATISMQSIARVEVTVDGGKTWKTATLRGVTVPQATVVGFRAIKKEPTLPWPTEPFKPQWYTPEAIDAGSEVWMRSETNAGTSVTAQCGNSIETKIHIAPNE